MKKNKGNSSVSEEDIIIALSNNPDVWKDVDALICRIAGVGKRNPLVDRLPKVIATEEKVIHFIKDSYGIWLDTHRIDEKGFIFDSISAKNYLDTFKEYERLWASRKNEGSDKANWYKMQDELANYITQF